MRTFRLRNALSATAIALSALVTGLTATQALADADIKLVIENHKFTPAEIRVPAGQKIRIVIDNRDATPEEFESATLRAEKIIPGKSKGMVIVGPLKPGKYPFFGEFNEATAQGVLIAE
ncbi:cupredoxin domain-containing protein [Uliginosibacterium sp. H3]|uniref:Cupredoxin domain-containing protein n=1 Tax=Uliginosibacterium silvisoli TaxID=3114758 RepID=A0ABU6JXL1_9RHOO|nr:cupredoxin domain-containing protein [Uliginosibacterium sp. H3]